MTAQNTPIGRRYTVRGPNQAFGAGGQPLPSQVAHQNTGATRSGSSAPTDSPGALNPEFVCWLMGYPSGWLD